MRPLFYLLILSFTVSPLTDLYVSKEIENNLEEFQSNTEELFYNGNKLHITEAEKEYIEDKHTFVGRNKRKNKNLATRHFKDVSSIVNNKSEDFSIDLFEEIYKE